MKKNIQEEKKQKQNLCYVSGYASVFNIVDAEGDLINKGAFTRSVEEIHNNDHNKPTHSIPFLYEHDYNQQIGFVNDIYEDDYGLYTQMTLNQNCPKTNHILEAVDSGLITGLSIGYRARNYSYDKYFSTRYLNDIEIYEVSLVQLPCNTKSNIISFFCNSDHFDK